MPFTPTHILAVVPVGYMWRKPVPFSALVIGSIVPDWPLYTLLSPGYSLTHSFVGVFTACLPFGFAVYVFFQLLLKRALFELLPQPFRQRLAPSLDVSMSFRVGSLVAVALAISVGAMTHVVWDAFTHQGRWGVGLVPILDRVAFTVGAVEIRGYKLLQYGSTVVGIPLLLVCLIQWSRTRRPQAIALSVLSPLSRQVLISAFVLIPFCFGMLAAAELSAFPMSPTILGQVAFAAITQAGFVLSLMLGCYGIIFFTVMQMIRV